MMTNGGFIGILVIVLITLLICYYASRAGAYRGVKEAIKGKQKYQLERRAEGLYIDNLGKINEGLGLFGNRSAEEKARLSELKERNEYLLQSEKDPEWIVAEMEKINSEVQRR